MPAPGGAARRPTDCTRTMTTTSFLPPDGDSVTRLVHEFYADVRADPLLGPVFDGAIGDHWDTHLPRMVSFWGTVMLGARSFQGNVFGKHMALEGVAPAHFAAWLGLWKKHTERLFAPEVAQEFQFVAHGIARNLFRGFFGVFPDTIEPDAALQ